MKRELTVIIARGKKLQKYKRGQALVELTLILPMLLALTLGAVELSNIIYTYQVMHHLTAQGANIAARLSEQPPSTPPTTFSDVVNKVIDASCPTIRQPLASLPNCSPPNDSVWRVIFTRIGPDTINPTQYVVLDQIVVGEAEIDDAKRICGECGLGTITNCTTSCIPPNNVPNIDKIVESGQALFAFEVFYDYTPITVLGNFEKLLGTGGDTFKSKFYERSIF